MILKYSGAPYLYQGYWAQGPANFDCYFRYWTATSSAYAYGAVALPPYGALCEFPTITIPLPPKLYYEVWSVETLAPPWLARLTITG